MFLPIQIFTEQVKADNSPKDNPEPKKTKEVKDFTISTISKADQEQK